MGWRHVVAGCTIVTPPVTRTGHMSLVASSISYKPLAATISFENLEYPLMLTMPWDNLNNFVGVIATNKDRILRT